jgi:hypothetical protein
LPVVRSREELPPVVVERDVLDRLVVPHEGAQALAVVVDVPQLQSLMSAPISSVRATHDSP